MFQDPWDKFQWIIDLTKTISFYQGSYVLRCILFGSPVR